MRNLILMFFLLLVPISGCSSFLLPASVIEGNLYLSVTSKERLQEITFQYTNLKQVEEKPTIKYIVYDLNENTIGSGIIFFDEILPNKSQTKTGLVINQPLIYKVCIKEATSQWRYSGYINGVHGYCYNFTW